MLRHERDLKVVGFNTFASKNGDITSNLCGFQDPEYSSHQNDRVEVIKLPSNGVYNLSTKSNGKGSRRQERDETEIRMFN